MLAGLGHPVPDGEGDLLAAMTWPKTVAGATFGLFRAEPHFASQAHVLHVCQFAPTFVGALETSRADVAALLAVIDAQGVAMPHKNRGMKRPHAANFSLLFPPAHAGRFVAADPSFALFGYSMDPACVS